ncbi:short chain dehydrogenase [Caballeronia arvi]|uniref:Short chain dehydrogenase n=1 Tax=Caballeronia arvi TaxID=1777135 RepID=A0A158L6Z7_9BURK|nr:short chain dehydrogenase [Caballeronia arvi]
MPALNTPQFDWALCHMPHAPQPVPPIFQPEVAAQAIVWAATHRRRELFVGLSSVKAIVGNMLAPGWLDHYLGRKGYAMQQRNASLPTDAPSNLFQSVHGKHRVHGSFDDEACASSPALWMDTHRGAMLIPIAVALALLCRRAVKR